MPNYYGKDGQRQVPYKEDSTKGGSIIQPLRYKGDVLTQVWIDGRMLATLANWLEKNGNYPRFMSEVVRIPLEILVETLTNNGSVEMVEDTVEARNMLQNRFKIDLNRGGRGGKNILHNQILTDQREELGERYFRKPRSVADQAIPIVPKEQSLELANLLKLYNETQPVDEVGPDESAIITEPPVQTKEDYLKAQAEIERLVNEGKKRQLENEDKE